MVRAPMKEKLVFQRLLVLMIMAITRVARDLTMKESRVSSPAIGGSITYRRVLQKDARDNGNLVLSGMSS
jgi:hypothetical protein